MLSSLLAVWTVVSSVKHCESVKYYREFIFSKMIQPKVVSRCRLTFLSDFTGASGTVCLLGSLCA